jgi:hypothetical protein
MKAMMAANIAPGASDCPATHPDSSTAAAATVLKTQDALDLSQGFMKAMMAANIGASDTAAAAALNPNATANVTAQDGPADTPAPTPTPTVADMIVDAMNVTRVGGLLANLPNMTNPITVIARVRDAVANSTGAVQPQERRTTVRLNTARDPTLPSWLNTGSPDLAPEVYSRSVNSASLLLANHPSHPGSAAVLRRDRFPSCCCLDRCHELSLTLLVLLRVSLLLRGNPYSLTQCFTLSRIGQCCIQMRLTVSDWLLPLSLTTPCRNADRTSRVLAALMASARESNTREETSGLVVQLSGGLDTVLKTAEAAAAARRASNTAVGATHAAPAGAIAGERPHASGSTHVHWRCL